jgi:hypothetical protein
MENVGVRRRGARGPGRAPAGGWWVVALVGAGAFWLANLAISLTPVALAYRDALSIAYGPMLAEAAVGGLVVATLVTLPLARAPDRMPGHGPVAKAVLLSLAALVLVTVLLEVPAKLRADVADPGHWLLVATVFNAVRIIALGVAIGLAARSRATRQDRHRAVASRKERS